MYKFWWERTAFDSLEDKQKHIIEMLNALNTALDDPKNQAGIIESTTEKFIKYGVLTL